MGPRRLIFDAPSLEAAGMLHYYDDPPIDDVCDTRIAQQGSDASISGKRCGRTFDEGALGSGGSGSGGTGSCTCTCPDGSDCTDATTPNPCGVAENGIPEPCGCPVDCN